ncbi:MAG: hypothetical protein JWO79_1337 [Actinomycetia bacterium]|nr:hypothetical protein [Actinomycetes bacterium]
MAALLVFLWIQFGVPVGTIARFGAYVVLGLAIPGTLLWRAFGPQLRFRAEEYAAGTAVGYAVEVLARIGASALGVPRLGLVVPLCVVAVFAVVPALRSRFRSAADPMPVPLASAYAGITGTVLIWFAYACFRGGAAGGGAGMADAFGGLAMPDKDVVFVLAFTADVAHRWPPEMGYVLGSPLDYHWFLAAHLAAAHDATGIELSTLLVRLALPVMLIVLVVGTGALAVRLSGRPWSGPLAAFLTLVVGEPLITGLTSAADSPRYAAFGNLLAAILYLSPTLTFSMALFAPLAILVVDIVRGTAARGEPGMRSWVLILPLLAAVSGAKGTVLPLVIAAAGTVLAAEAVVRRRVHRPALALLTAASATYAIAYWLVYGGQSYGMRVEPLGVVAQSAVASTFTGHWPAQPGLRVSAVITILMLVFFAAPWSGALLLAARDTRRDPAVWALGGVAGAAIATAVLLYHSGQSQLYFYRNALPLLAAGAAWAIAARLPSGRRGGVLALSLLAAGAAAGVVCAAVFGVRLTIRGVPGFSIGALLRPVLVLALLVAVIAAAASRRRAAVPLALVLVFAGAGSVRVGAQAVYGSALALTGHLGPRTPARAGSELTAARWLRDHSGVRDVVLTNVHCAGGPYAPPKPCDALSFWVSAYTERRVLVEGWGYTTENALMGAARPGRSYPNTLPFWDQALLRRNDAFLARPTRAEALALRQRYGVRWVFTDAGSGPVSAQLATVTTERFAAGPVRVYEIRG